MIRLRVRIAPKLVYEAGSYGVPDSVFLGRGTWYGKAGLVCPSLANFRGRGQRLYPNPVKGDRHSMALGCKHALVFTAEGYPAVLPICTLENK